MKLTYYEFRKIIGKRIFLIVLALCFVINIFLLYYTESSKEENSRLTYADKYVDMVNQYKELPTNDAIKKVKNQQLAFDIYNEMNSLAYATDEDEVKEITSTLQQYKKNNPDAYKKAEKIAKQGGNTWESIFLTDISNQLEYIKSYPDFIGQMRQRADLQSSVSVFEDKGSFSYNNLYKTADDYEHLKNVKLSVGNSNALSATTDYNLTDYLVIAIVFLACIYLFGYERDKGLFNLVKSSKNGRLKTILAKLFVLFVVSLVVSLLFTAGNYVTNTILYGADDLNRNIQSISEFRNCVFDISAWQYLILFAFMKVIGVLIIASVFSMVFILVSSPALMYIISVGFVVVEYLLYTLIPASSAFNYPKYINVCNILNNSFIADYVNLNIFSNAVTAFPLVLCVFAIVAIVCLAITCIIFTNKNQTKKTSLLSKYFERIKFKLFKIKGSTNLLFGESYKFLIQNKMVVLIIILLGFGVVNSIGSVAYSYVDPSDAYYKTYMEKLEGDITTDKVDFINKEDKYFIGLENRIASIENETNLSNNAKSAVITSINSIIETKGAAFDRVKQQYERIKKLEKTGVKPRFIDEIIYNNFVSNGIREWNNFALLFLVLIIMLPVIYTCEYKNNMIYLIRPTKNGKTSSFIRKSLISFFALIVSFITVYLPYFIRFIHTYSTTSFSTSIKCLLAEDKGLSLTIVGAVILSLVCYFILAIFAVSLINLISVLIKNNLMAMLLSSALLLIPSFAIVNSETIRFGNFIVNNSMVAVTIILVVCIVLSVIFTLISHKIYTEE